MKKCFKLFFAVGVMCLSSCGVTNNNKSDDNDKGNYHTIVWLNYDNSLLYKDTKVEEGATPAYTGDAPTKPSTQQYSYTFSGWSPDVVPAYIDATYVAQFSESLNKYTVIWKDDDERVLLTEKYDYGSTPSYRQNLPNKDKDGYRYTFKSWSPAIQTVTGDATYTATYNKTAISYTITYNLNGGTNSSNNPSSYTVESNVTFQNASRTGYQFDGWYKGNTKVTSIAPGSSTGDITLDARWTALKNTLSVTSQDPSKGTVSIVSGSGYTDEIIIVEATPASNCVFKGWYQGTSLVSKQARYTFTMPTSDYSLSARFLTQAEEEEERNKALGITPIIDAVNNTVTYGLYPQKNVNDSTLLSSLNALTTPESNGWYLYNNEYYAKLSAKPYNSNYTFDNGTTIVSGTTYWFKCEPITWNILSEANDEYYLLSSVLLDTTQYDDSSNNYKESEIRSWLNNEFYNSAFALGSNCIETANIDNGASTTNSDSNQYACENTEDKIFLPSYKDYLNENYGFSSSTSSTKLRECKTTDWARARGTYSSTISKYLYNGFYWTRSPISSSSDFAWDVNDDGCFHISYVNNDNRSVRPSLSLSIAE